MTTRERQRAIEAAALDSHLRETAEELVRNFGYSRQDLLDIIEVAVTAAEGEKRREVRLSGGQEQ